MSSAAAGSETGACPSPSPGTAHELPMQQPPPQIQQEVVVAAAELQAPAPVSVVVAAAEVPAPVSVVTIVISQPEEVAPEPKASPSPLEVGDGSAMAALAAAKEAELTRSDSFDEQCRCYFVSTALNDKLYVTGGLGLTDKSPNSWDIYDKATKSWFAHKNPMLTPDIVKFVALDGEHTQGRLEQDVLCGIYNRADQTWRGTANEIALCWSSPTVILDDGTLYMLDQSLGTKLMMWLNETKEWVMLGRLSDKLTHPPCELVAVGRKIYVIGRGPSTVMIDVDMAGRVDGFLLSSSTGPLMEHDLAPERCRVITI